MASGANWPIESVPLLTHSALLVYKTRARNRRVYPERTVAKAKKSSKSKSKAKPNNAPVEGMPAKKKPGKRK